MRRYSLLIIILYSAIQCFAQSALEDFTKINSLITTTENLSLDIEYKVYANHLSKTPKETTYGYLKQKGDQVLQGISSLQTLYTEKICAHVDTVEKIIVLNDPLKINEQRKEAMHIDIKNILNYCRNITYKEVSKTSGTYVLEYKENSPAEFERCDIFIDRKINFITKIVLYYTDEIEVEDNLSSKKESPRLEITYSKIDTNPKFKRYEFDEKRFLDKKNGKYFPASRYKGFKLIDNRYYTKNS